MNEKLRISGVSMVGIVGACRTP